MRVVSLNGHVFDLDELTSSDPRNDSVLLTFKNGDRIDIAWRDGFERAQVFQVLGLSGDKANN